MQKTTALDRRRKTEKNIQAQWVKKGTFETEPDSRKKFFITTPYPYTNARLHIGFAFTLTRSDVLARYHRLKGENVLQPQAFHLTGEPLVSAAKRIEEKDEIQLETLRKSGVPEKEIEKFADPEYYAKYFIKLGLYDLKEFGIGVDWRRFFFTTPLFPEYDIFIQWQYRKLKALGLVKKGTHPVIWCPVTKSPTGDHDRLEGEGETIEEFVALKFKGREGIYPCATLRPETTYGVTNLWINPTEVYVRAEMDGETIIVAQKAIQKLKDQNHEVKELNEVTTEKILKDEVINPLTGEKIPIIPATFVKGDHSTGVVMSVPAHAPYDLIAWLEAKKDNFKPLPLKYLIDVPDFPNLETLLKNAKIHTQNEHGKLEKLTKQVYLKEFSQGIMNENTDFPGKPVKKAKEMVKLRVLNEKKAFVLYETSGKVISRRKALCHVKILKDQWFLRYGSKKWKDETRRRAKKMIFLPEEARTVLMNRFEEYEDKACARQSGLGTRLPWKKDWVIESLSDSTIYMAFYIVAKYVNDGSLKKENINDAFFDFVFCGEGTAKTTAEKTKCPLSLLKTIRKDFLYYYPVDVRNSGKDLLSNHLIYYLYHHAALFPEKHFPRAITANGFTILNGKKMSKSTGNFITIRNAIDSFGVDATRIALIDTAEGLENANIQTQYAKDLVRKIDNIALNAKKWLNEAGVEKQEFREKWLNETIERHLQKTVAHLERAETRSALQPGFHGIWRDISKYVSMGDINPTLLRKSIRLAALTSAPFAPHLAEEIWTLLGKKESIFSCQLPTPKTVKTTYQTYFNFLDALIKDLSFLTNRLGPSYRKATVFVAREEKFRKLKKGLTHKEEQNVLKEGLPILFRATGLTITIDGETNTKGQKARPGKPAILLSEN